VKKLFFALGSMAVATSTAWAQSDGSPNAPYSRDSGFYSSESPYVAADPTYPAYRGFDPTAHYWDYYRLDPGHGIDVDRTTPP
jgi:hypothetical protein